MKVLFLDIDGVLNYSGSKARFEGLLGIEPVLADRVKRIVKETGCDVVLSSTWRLYEKHREEVKRAVGDFIDVTPRFSSSGYRDGSMRGDEVKDWLDNHPDVDKYAILDDDSDFYPDQPLFHTSIYTGITDEITDKVIAYLNE